MNTDQVIEGIGKAVAATASQEYCLFWSDYWWWMCMTKSEWSGWMQAIGSILAIGAAFLVMDWQLRVEKLRDRVTSASLLSSFGGALESVGRILPPDGDRSAWTVRRVQVLIESEQKRADAVALHALSLDEQKGVFNFRMAAMQIVEALRIVETELDESTDEAVVNERAYTFLQDVLTDAKAIMTRGREQLAPWIKD